MRHPSPGNNEACPNGAQNALPLGRGKAPSLGSLGRNKGWCQPPGLTTNVCVPSSLQECGDPDGAGSAPRGAHRVLVGARPRRCVRYSLQSSAGETRAERAETHGDVHLVPVPQHREHRSSREASSSITGVGWRHNRKAVLSPSPPLQAPEGKGAAPWWGDVLFSCTGKRWGGGTATNAPKALGKRISSL